MKKRRWLIYIAVGILFGVFDFYYPDILDFSFHPRFGGHVIGFGLNFGIWLVPAISIIIYEAKVSRSRVLPALASSLTWCISVIFYYLTNVVQLLIGISTMPELRISNHKFPFFWSNWENELNYILWSTLEWIVAAIISGFIIGFLVSFIYLYSLSELRY